MKCFRFLVVAGAMAVLTTFAQTADARGSWGSSGGSWGSSGGSWGSSGGSSGGSWGSRGSSGGSWGSRGSSGGSWGSSGGSSGGRVGPLRRMISRMHARRTAHSHGSHGSSGGSSGGSWGSSGGSSGGSTGYATYRYSTPVVHATSLGTTSTYESPVIQSTYQSYTPMGGTVIQGGTTGGVIQGGTTTQQGGATTDTAPAEPEAADTNDSAGYESSKPGIESDAAVLTVAVPGDATVLVNGHSTTSDGTIRRFKSRGLKEGYVYTYVVKATYHAGGQARTETKSVKLRSGSQERLEFVAPELAPEATVSNPVESADVLTVVRLHVPADAQVTLAGNETNGTGAVRTFRTKQLRRGQQWAGYTIRVTAVIGGQTVSKERTIDVTAGSTNDLTFDFNDSIVARR